MLNVPVCLILIGTAEAAGGEAVSPFAGTIIQSITAIVVVAILFLILRRFAWGPILKGLQAREEKIRSDLEQAEAAARQANETLQEYQRQLAQAQAQARQIIEQARQEAQRISEELRQQSEEEIRSMRKRAEYELRAAREEALAQLYAEAAILATEIAGRILRREIRPEDHRDLVHQTVEEFQQRYRGPAGSN